MFWLKIVRFVFEDSWQCAASFFYAHTFGDFRFLDFRRRMFLDFKKENNEY